MKDVQNRGGYIYKLTNKGNGKVYIGLTTTSLEKRLIQHHYDSRHGVDRPLYRAMRKYGEDAFIAEIIDTADTLDDLKKKEQYWIKKYNSYGANGEGYNATIGGDMTYRSCIKYARCSALTGEILEIFDSAVDCNNKYSNSVANADKVTTYQLIDSVFVRYSNIENKTKQEIKDYIFSLRPKIICQINPNTKTLKRWLSGPELTKAGYSRSCVSECINGRRKTHHKCFWKHYDQLSQEELLLKLEA